MWGFGMSITPGNGTAGLPWNGSPLHSDLMLCAGRQTHLPDRKVNKVWESNPLVGTTNQKVQLLHPILHISRGSGLALYSHLWV